MIILGDLRSEMAKELQRLILAVVDSHKDKETYFILVYAGIDVPAGIVMTKIILLDKKPPKMLGTLLYFVDNRKGKIERVWALPLDHDVVIDPSDEIVEEIFRSAQNMPILKS